MSWFETPQQQQQQQQSFTNGGAGGNGFMPSSSMGGIEGGAGYFQHQHHQQQQSHGAFGYPITSVGFEIPPAASTFASGTMPTSNNNMMTMSSSNAVSSAGVGIDYSNEPPLLVELGINFNHIGKKTLSALSPLRKLDPQLMSDGDLAGPFVFCVAFGFLLMLAGKLHFGYVFGFGAVGSLAMHTLLNLMSSPEKRKIELHVVVSVLGYALIPIVGVAALAVVRSLQGPFGLAFVSCGVGWCTVTATRFFEAALDARDQRYLIAYPTFLLFACFALITVF